MQLTPADVFWIRYPQFSFWTTYWKIDPDQNQDWITWSNLISESFFFFFWKAHFQDLIQPDCQQPIQFLLNNCWINWLSQRFNQSAYHRSAYFACLSLLTHLIQIISSFMNCVLIDMNPTQCSLLSTPWAGEIHWSLLHFGTFIHIFVLRHHLQASSHYRWNLQEKCDIIYLCK